jgi:hypothetical protein
MATQVPARRVFVASVIRDLAKHLQQLLPSVTVENVPFNDNSNAFSFEFVLFVKIISCSLLHSACYATCVTFFQTSKTIIIEMSVYGALQKTLLMKNRKTYNHS